MAESFDSVGIDIGTTSTHLIVSRLGYANQGTPDQVPKVSITSREIIYEGKIHLTPITDQGVIDAAGVAEIIRAEYQAAGVDPASIRSGAAIITGETARLRNAEEVIHALADMAGDLVAASTGPHLESILAARGSGAAQASARDRTTICNVDIGGGTTNIAVFKNGELLDTACLAIGGRGLTFTRDGRVKSVSESAETFTDAVARTVTPGTMLPPETMEHLGALMAESIIQYLCSSPKPQIAQRLLVTDSLRFDYSIDEYWISGGVAELMQSPLPDLLAFGDLGGYLAAGVTASLSERNITYRIPPMPIRATVIGAGLHSVQLSGSTVLAHEEDLPIRNLPLISPFPEAASADLVFSVKSRLAECLKQHDIDWSATPVSVRLPVLPDTTFETLSAWSSALAKAFTELGGKEPMVIIAAQDIGLALGQLIASQIPKRQLIVLDGISLIAGDYIDIGKPLPRARALPVVIKDLVFGR